MSTNTDQTVGVIIKSDHCGRARYTSQYKQEVLCAVSAQQSTSCSFVRALAALDGLRGGGAGFDPVGWKEFFELPGGRVVHQFFKHPFEVGEGIGPVAADLLYEGVEDRAAPAGVFAAE